MRDGVKKPWPLLFILLAAMMPGTGNNFLYSFALLATAKDWGVTPFWASIAGFMPMLANPIGGVFFGWLSDRRGRRTALLWSLVLSALAAALCGLAYGPFDFAFYRLLLGMSVGGQWGVCMSLVSEIWPAAQRGRAVGIVQTSFPVGFVYASLLAFLVAESLGWRALFLMGALPGAIAVPMAFFTIKESRLWTENRSQASEETATYGEIFQKGLRKHTVLSILIMFIGAFGAWSFNPWIPAYLGTLGFSPREVPLITLYIMIGAVAGYAVNGFISDRLGRKATFRLYFIGMAATLAAFGYLPSQSWFMEAAGYPTAAIVLQGGAAAFFLGYFSGYGALFAELYPTRLRSRGMGFCYSFGRMGSAVGPASTGYLSSLWGIGGAFMIAALVFLAGAALMQFFPETRGKKL